LSGTGRRAAVNMDCMPQRNPFEFGDLPRVPAWYLRNLRSYLAFSYRLFRHHLLWVPDLAEFIRRSGARTFVEFGAGRGEVLPELLARLPGDLIREKSFVLTDLHPMAEGLEAIRKRNNPALAYCEKSVDASNPPEELRHPGIFINSFHHLDADQIAAIVRPSLRSGNGLLILEYVRPTPLALLSMPIGVLMILLTLPWVVKRRDLPLLFVLTYLIPVFPLMFLWDGVSSCLRAYTGPDLKRILADHGISAEVIYSSRRSLFFPSGVTAITLLPDSGTN